MYVQVLRIYLLVDVKMWHFTQDSEIPFDLVEAPEERLALQVCFVAFTNLRPIQLSKWLLSLVKALAESAHGQARLLSACSSGDLELVKKLLKRGTNPDSADIYVIALGLSMPVTPL
jgi:hypothetical protein